MDFVTAGLAGAVPIAAAGLGWLAARQRNMDRWLLPYLAQRLTRPAPQPGKRVCLLLCVADHFEPRHEARSPAQARDRVERWMTEYPRLFGEFRDADGRPPRHSFFYPLEQYDRWEMATIWPNFAVRGTARWKSTCTTRTIRPTTFARRSRSTPQCWPTGMDCWPVIGGPEQS